MSEMEWLEYVDRTLEIESRSIESLRNTISKEALVRLIKAIWECEGKVLITGCGTSGVAAKKIVHSLCCIEIPACYLNPSDAAHGELGLVQKDDIVIFISKGGKTEELVDLIPACKKKGATLVAVTENMESTIAKEADIVLKVKVDKEPDRFNMLATASILAVIAVFDSIIITLMHEKNYTKEQFSLIHPGGAVGERLLNNG